MIGGPQQIGAKNQALHGRPDGLGFDILFQVAHFHEGIDIAVGRRHIQRQGLGDLALGQRGRLTVEKGKNFQPFFQRF